MTSIRILVLRIEFLIVFGDIRFIIGFSRVSSLFDTRCKFKLVITAFRLIVYFLNILNRERYLIEDRCYKCSDKSNIYGVTAIFI